MRNFKIDKNYYGDRTLFKKGSFSIKEGLTVLIGCNGSGKSTMLRTIKNEIDKDKDIVCLFCDNKERSDNLVSESIWVNDISMAATSMFSSEGERKRLSAEKMASEIGNMVYRNPDAKEYWVLIDTIDSGLSIDVIKELKEDLFYVFIDDIKNNKHKPVYIVVTANTFEMAKGEQCMIACKCEYVEEEMNYENYYTSIMCSKYDKIESIEAANKNRKDKNNE